MLSVGSVFSGAGLLDCGLAQTGGFEHAWFCEADEFRRGLLARRWPGALILDDIRGLRADVVRRVDVLAGGFPCRGISSAGRRDGFDNDQTVLWHEMARAIGELQPRYVLIENVADILTMAAAPGEPRGSLWGAVLGDLAEIGYDAEWECLPAGACGAPHLRDRLFAVACHTASAGGQGAWPGRQALGQASTADPRIAANGSRDAEGGPGAQAGADGERAWAGDNGAPANADGAQPWRDAGEFAVAAGRQDDRGGDQRPIAHADGARRKARRQSESTRESGGGSGPGQEHRTGGPEAPVEWGEFEPAIRRWERVHGRAPAPLTGVRGVDDGDAKLRRVRARMDRSRLSALGDGVHVYIGRIAGERILELEEQRLMAASGSYRRTAA